MANLINDIALFRVSAFNSQESGDAFFNQFLFVQLMSQNRYSDVISYGMELLNECKNTDLKAFNSIHKGTPYYWMGMAAFLSNDFVSAVYFFDQALSEDIRNKTKEKLIISPSYLFVTLNDKIEFQAARDLVTNTISTIDQYISIYNDPYLGTKKLSIESICNCLILPSTSEPDHPWRTLSTSFISFFLEWNYRQSLINLRDQDNSKEAYFVHLFKGCLLVESLLKANNKNPIPNTSQNRTMGRILRLLRKDLGLEASNCDIGDTTFPKILSELETIHGGLPKYIEITGKIRNTLGHNLVWNVNLNHKDYHLLFSCISLSILHILNQLFL